MYNKKEKKNDGGDVLRLSSSISELYYTRPLNQR